MIFYNKLCDLDLVMTIYSHDLPVLRERQIYPLGLPGQKNVKRFTTDWPLYMDWAIHNDIHVYNSCGSQLESTSICHLYIYRLHSPYIVQ